MNVKILFIAGFVLSVFTVNSQDFSTDELAQTEIMKLEFMVGQWSGTGWMIGRDGVKHEFDQTEDVSFKLDNTILRIEGKGKSNGVVTHNAFAIVSFNKEEENYHFQSWLANGQNGNFKGEIKDNAFYWYPNEYVRYILYLNDKGQWYEKGEMNRGGTWVQFFEMTLDKP